MNKTKEQRMKDLMENPEYIGNSGRPPIFRCNDCKTSKGKLMEMNGKFLCRDCIISVINNPDDGIVNIGITKIYHLMERLSTSENKHKSGIICNIWDSIKVTGITVNRGRKENFYHIKLIDGEIILNETESLTCTKFRIEFQRIHGILLPNLPYTQWACLITEWLKNRELGIEVEEISEHQEIVDSVIENITSSRLVKGTGASIFGTVYYHDDAILVPNETIKNISSKINRNLGLRKVSSIVSDYLIGPTKTYRTVEGVVRMWRFDPVKLNIRVEDAIEEYEDDDDN